MARRKYTISKNKLITTICLFSMLEPPYFSGVDRIDMVYSAFSAAIIFYTVGMTINALRSKNRVLRNDYIILLMVFFGYQIVNTFVQHHHNYSQLYSLFSQLCFCLYVAIQAQRDHKNLFSALSTVTILYLVANFATLVLFPNGVYTNQTVYGNITNCWLLGSKNPISRFAVMTTGIVICNAALVYNKLRIKDILVLIFGLVNIVWVQSATSLIGIAVMVAFLLLSRRKQLPKLVNLRNVYIVTIIVSLLLIFTSVSSIIPSNLLNIFDRSQGFYGRTHIWQRSLAYIMHSPIFGQGIESSSAIAQKIGGNHTHNYFLYTLYSGGIIGFVLLYSAITKLSKRLANTSQYLVSRVLASIIAAVFVMGITESMTSTPLYYPILVAAYYLCDNREGNDILTLTARQATRER